MDLYDSLHESEDSNVYENVRRVMRENGGVLGAKRENFVRRNSHVPRTTLIVGIVGELRDPNGKVVGSAAAGKDTVAQAIIDRYIPEIRVKRVALADALKVEVYNWLASAAAMFALGFNDTTVPGGVWPLFEQPGNREYKIQWVNDNKNYLRELLQKWGTEYRRRQDESYWIDKLLTEVDRLGAQVVVVPDVRFLNECDMCHATLKVVRPVAAVNSTISQHVSETELAGHIADFTILNDAGLAQLTERSCEVFEKLLFKFHVN